MAATTMPLAHLAAARLGFHHITELAGQRGGVDRGKKSERLFCLQPSVIDKRLRDVVSLHELICRFKTIIVGLVINS